MAPALTALALAGALAASAPPTRAGREATDALARCEARAGGALPDLVTVAQSALPSVVGVLTLQVERPKDGADPLKDFVERFRGEGARRGIASGFIVRPDGLVLTNAHVIEGAARIEVQVGEGDERFVARLVGHDDASDVALLKIDVGHPLPALPLGDSDRLRIAEWVLVVGNPFGLAHSVTQGIVSQTGRSNVVPPGRDGYFDFIQTDAPINPGNSGGPLLNLRGEVVGMATAINATGQGIGFALPINMAKEVLRQILEHGRVIRSWLGVSVREQEAGSAREVLVTAVHAGSPAATSGLLPGDVITGFEGRRIASAARLRWNVSTAGVGRDVSLTVRRGSGERSLRVHLAALPEHPHGEPEGP